MTMIQEANGIEAMTAQWVPLCAQDELEDGAMAAFEVGDYQVALYRVGGSYFATTNVCSHAYTLLTDGWLEGRLVECPLHGAQFDVASGEVVRGPADCPVQAYEVRINDNLVEVKLD